MSSLGPTDKLPPCLKVGHYRPPEHRMALRWALIAISSLASLLDSTGGQEVAQEFSTVDSWMWLLRCVINTFCIVPTYTSAAPCDIVTTWYVICHLQWPIWWLSCQRRRGERQWNELRNKEVYITPAAHSDRKDKATGSQCPRPVSLTERAGIFPRHSTNSCPLLLVHRMG